jgi:hypothetical protein
VQDLSADVLAVQSAFALYREWVWCIAVGSCLAKGEKSQTDCWWCEVPVRPFISCGTMPLAFSRATHRDLGVVEVCGGKLHVDTALVYRLSSAAQVKGAQGGLSE